MIKPIETEYNGYLFRSRLEARWAVFFDSVGAKWEYEPQGFELSDGTRYLPDFYLPDLDLYVEIKGVMTEKDRHKIDLFAKEGRDIISLGSIPSAYDSSDLVCFYYSLTPGNRWQFDMLMYFEGGVWSDPPYLPCVCPKCGRFGFAFEGRGARICGNKCFPGRDKEYSYNHPVILNALDKARKARFEHGETPSFTEIAQNLRLTKYSEWEETLINESL